MFRPIQKSLALRLGNFPTTPSGLTRDELRRCSPFRTESRRLRFRSSLSFRSVNPRLPKCRFRNAQFRSRAPRMARVRPRKFAQKFRITCSRSRSPPKADLSAARRGARTSNIPKPARTARSKKANKVSRLLRVPGPSTEAERSAAKGGAATWCYAKAWRDSRLSPI